MYLKSHNLGNIGGDHRVMQGVFICVFVFVSMYLKGTLWTESHGRANETTAVNAPGIANVADLTLVDNDRVDKNRGQ